MPCKDIKKRKEYDKRWYLNNKDRIKERVSIYGKERGRKIREFLFEYRTKRKCSSCPENNPCCLEFHHIDPSKKEIEIGKAASRKWSIERLKKEIKKCLLLCANCHRKLHYNEKQKMEMFK